ncbi:MAG: SpoIIE family protein phosphatase [Verrucomicrobia bacterium]|nr:SpoIIE family protein phosphatase [Verrucomicrobiota bacterium]
MNPLPNATQANAAPRLLVADDDALGRDVLARRLEKEGFAVVTVENGRKAMERLEHERFDLLLLDIIMPEMNGTQLLEQLKSSEQWRELPVIMIAALDDLDSVAHCIALGADDYLPKPFNPVLLCARIRSCLEKKQLREKERAAHCALQESQARLAAELAEAAAYVCALLPPPMTGDIQTEWRFIPSTSLGGDSFGYHWLDENHLAMYLLDVCGHGVGAALLSISVMNVLRSQTLAATDFKKPAAVLSRLNEVFQMDRQNDMYFTIWYGVFNKARREIVHACGGHPPAILLTGDNRESATVVELKAPGTVIGMWRDVCYQQLTQPVGPFAHLYLFSDGVYEITRPDGTMWDITDFITLLTRPPSDGQSEIETVLKHARAMQASDVFEDDFSIVKFTLGGSRHHTKQP